jgi:hypothetical protein
MLINRNWYHAEGALHAARKWLSFSPLQGLFLFAPALRDDDLTEKQRKESGLYNPSTNFGCIAFRVTTSYRMLTTFGVAIASMRACETIRELMMGQ